MAEIIEEKVNKLVINRLTREEYRELEERGLVQRNEIYLFPDPTESDIEQLIERVEQLEISNLELVEITNQLDEIINGSSEDVGLAREVEIIKEVLNGKDGKDGLIDKVNDINNRVDVIEEWIEGQSSEGSVESRLEEVEHRVDDISSEVDEIHNHITNIENNMIPVEVVESSEFDGIIIYCGTSTKVMDESWI